MRLLLTLALATALTTPAIAAGWSSYENTFPAYPCQDGWAGCIVDGAPSGPGALKDAAGRPLPSDARFGWFDLKPTVRVSPFASLSAYTGPLGGAVAVVEAPRPTPVERPVQNDGGGEPVAARTDAPGPAEVRPVSSPSTTYTAPPSTASSAPVSAAPTSGGGMRPGSPSSATPATTQSTAPQTASTATATTGTPTSGGGMRPGGPSSTTPAAATAQPVSSPPPTTSSAQPVSSSPVAVATAPQDDSCTDLVRMEPGAMMGQLRVAQTKCLEARVGAEGQQTTKDKVSRIMITNAEAKGDKAEWERLMKRHLEDIDRSDPDLCFKYALHLSRGGVGRAQGVVRWADYALENKAKWSGTTYKTRVFNLYKLRAEAANKLWQETEKEFMEKDHSEENEAKAAKYRGQAKDYSREWLDYAKASAQDTKTAMALCVSSSGNRAFCEGG